MANRSDSKPTARRGQFSLRTLLLGTMWFALIWAVCLQDQHAAARRREAKALLLPAAGRLGPMRLQPAAPRPAAQQQLSH